MIIGALLCLADVIVNILPLPIVATMNLPLRQRVEVGILLSLGAVATIAGIVREVFIYKVLFKAADPILDAFPLWICADVELYLAILCGCAPTLKSLFEKLEVCGMPHFLKRQKLGSEPAAVRPETLEQGLHEVPQETFMSRGSRSSSVTLIAAATSNDISGPGSPSKSSYNRRESTNSCTCGIQVDTRIHMEEIRPKDDSCHT
ncbi:hypothetical protein AAFC00_002697 [Neodothiora populina]|uniref:Rhodopsin domain-containing protein n=1 Tax=Neodothiora populina TaxID=2781224 RepID=A0ABR3P7X3_9PEZI